MEKNKYVEFMLDPANKMNCKACPENTGSGHSTEQLPCGQPKCWVQCHCAAAGLKTEAEGIVSLQEKLAEGVKPEEIAVIAYSKEDLGKDQSAESRRDPCCT